MDTMTEPVTHHLRGSTTSYPKHLRLAEQMSISSEQIQCLRGLRSRSIDGKLHSLPSSSSSPQTVRTVLILVKYIKDHLFKIKNNHEHPQNYGLLADGLGPWIVKQFIDIYSQYQARAEQIRGILDKRQGLNINQLKLVVEQHYLFIMRQTKALAKQSTLCVPEDEEETPLVKRKTEEDCEGSIFAKKQDLKNSFYLRRKRKKDKNGKPEAASFDNPFIKMKMETSQSNRNSRRLVLACIDVELRYANPQSAPTSAKRKLASPLSIRQKSKNTHEHPHRKQNTERVEPPRSLIKKSKPYIDYLDNHTEIFLQKMKDYRLRKDVHPAKTLTKSKKRLIAPRTFEIFRLQNQENTTFWPFNPYKTIRDRTAKNKEVVHSQELRQASHFKL